jgi:hypothetical protein
MSMWNMKIMTVLFVPTRPSKRTLEDSEDEYAKNN